MLACACTRAHIIQKILSQGAGGEALQPREEKVMPPVRLCSLLPALSGFVRCDSFEQSCSVRVAVQTGTCPTAAGHTQNK